MSRPEGFYDIPSEKKQVSVALFHFSEFKLLPDVVSAYADFLKSISSQGGAFEEDYGSVKVTRPKNEKELQQTLKQEQSDWDNRQKWYEQWMNGEEFKYPHLVDVARKHAQEEGLPEPETAVEEGSKSEA